jgi:hypothetical protein
MSSSQNPVPGWNMTGSSSDTNRRLDKEGQWASPGYRSARTRSRWAVGGLAVAGFSAFAAMGQAINGFKIIDDAAAGTLTDAAAEAFDRNTSSVSSFGLVVVIATALLFLAWLSRSVENVPPLRGGTPKESPRASIIWWFIPFASFVMPYRVVADLYRRMLSTARPGDASVAIVVIWWLCFLGQGLLGRLSSLLPVTTLAALRESVSLSLASSTVELTAAVLAIVVVRRIQHGADRRAGELGLGPVVAGPAWPTAPADQQADPSASAAIETQPTALPAVPSAGAQQAAGVTFCPSCGTARLGDARFCAKCGRDLEPA